MYFDWLRVWVENPIYYDAIYYPTAAVLRGVACTFYLVIGRFLLLGFRQIRGVIYIKILLVAICVICLISSIYLSQFLLGTNFSLLNLGSQPYLIFACGILGTIWVISIFYLLRNVYSFPLLQWVGKKSLVIMGTHMSLLLTIVVPFLLRHIVSAPAYNTLEYYLFGVVCVIIMLIAEIPIIKIFDGPLKCLISKRNQN